MTGVALAWNAIPASSPMIQYTGNWDFNTYKPLDTNATAAMNFTGSGIAFAGSGNAGSRTDQGVLFNIDPESDDPYNTTVLLGFTPGNSSRGSRWLERDIPPGEHVVELSARAPNLNVTFFGFEVQVNATVPLQTPNNGSPIVRNRTLDADFALWLGRKEVVGNTTYARGDRGGFSFNFTGPAVTVYGQDTFTQATNYSVWFNVTDIPSTQGVAPYAQYRAEEGRGGVIFYAGALPLGNHRILLVKDQAPANEQYDDLGFTNATVMFPQLNTNYTTACFGSCGSGESDHGTGIGSSYDQHSGINRKFGWSASLAMAGLAAGLALAL